MTDLSRRALLGAGAAGMAAAAVAAAPIAAEAAAPLRVSGLYSRKRFLPLRGRPMWLSDGIRSWPVRLGAVSDLSPALRGADGSFTLTFHSTVAGPPQGTYTLTYRGFVATTMFVVPSDARRRTYQVVVNRV